MHGDVSPPPPLAVWKLSLHSNLICLALIVLKGDGMHRIASLVLVVSGLLLGGCGQGGAPVSNERLLESFEQGRTGIWVSAEAPVAQMLGDEDFRGRYQRFTIRPRQDITVQVRHSLEHSTRVPVKRGDIVRVTGYYEWDARGGFISRTFSDSDQPGGGGWIEHQGERYD